MSTNALYLVSVTVHVLAAFFWLGGMFFLAAVGAPVLRQVEPQALRTDLFRRLGERFRTLGWAAILVLLVTGALNLRFRGLLSWDVLGGAELWASPYGRALAWKLAAVAAMLAVQALHDFVLGPRVARLGPGDPALARARGHAALLARVSALLGILVVVAAVRLARGG
jgi:uncharacterized membrane protein